MIYLDYAANTPVDEKVIENFVDVTKKYIANPNSNHTLGKTAKNQIDIASTKISNYFNANKESVIYTSGASEANNLIIKGVAQKNKSIGKHIIVSAIEHSSIIAPCNFLTSLGYDISIIPLTKDGIIDLNILRKTLTDKTILVSICTVDSELGIVQPINEIANIIKNFPNCLFHTDATQAIGKVKIDYTGVDFITFAPHKFYGLNGIGVLMNISNNKIVPLIHGGKSTTIYRSGTPMIANISALAKAFELATNDLEKRYSYILKLNYKLRKELSKYKKIHINSPENAIPNILNISFVNLSSKEIIEKLDEKEIYVSSTTACSLENLPSKTVFAISGDERLATNTLRISLSHLTTDDEINSFLYEFDNIYRLVNSGT